MSKEIKKEEEFKVIKKEAILTSGVTKIQLEKDWDKEHILKLFSEQWDKMINDKFAIKAMTIDTKEMSFYFEKYEV